MLKKQTLSWAVMVTLSMPVFANDLAPQKYDFIDPVIQQCTTGIEDCPDDANIAALVNDISTAESTLAANEVAVGDAQTSLNEVNADNASTPAQITAAQDALNAAVTARDNTQTQLNALNDRATALRESETLKAVYDYYDSKNDIANQTAVVADAELDEQTAKNNIPGLITAVSDAETALTNAETAEQDAQTELARVVAEENAKAEPDTAAIEAATQAVIDAQLEVANQNVAVGVAKSDKETGDALVIAAEQTTESAKEVLAAYNTNTVSLGEAAVSLMTSIDGYLEQDATHKTLTTSELAADAAEAANAKQTAQSELDNAQAVLAAAQASLEQAESDRDVARNALSAVDITNLEALKAAAANLAAANEAVVAANTVVANAVADEGGAQNALDAASIAADQAQVLADTALDTSTQAQIATLEEDNFSDSGSPAVPLRDSFVAGNDEGQAIIDAVHSNFQATETNQAAIESNDTDIAANLTAIQSNDADIAANLAAIQSNDADIADNLAAIQSNDTDIATNVANISSNKSSIESNTGAIANNSASIANNALSIESLEHHMAANVDMLKSGIASSLAIAGMPIAVGEGLGFSVGFGHFEGENAAALGLTHVSDNRTFKLSVGHANGSTSGSFGAAFKF
jgi:hypothetical protein